VAGRSGAVSAGCPVGGTTSLKANFAARAPSFACGVAYADALHKCEAAAARRAKDERVPWAVEWDISRLPRTPLVKWRESDSTGRMVRSGFLGKASRYDLTELVLG
jgi:hypothetical protein